jgi:hypothetical protein
MSVGNALLAAMDDTPDPALELSGHSSLSAALATSEVV